MSHKTGFEKDRPSLLLNGGRQFQFGRWFRRGSTITVLPKSNALAAEQQASYELSGGGIPRLSGLKLTPGAALRVRGSRLDAASTRTTSRVLTYTSKDVIDDRISIPAQHSLVRLSKNSATNADAVGMLEEVKAGRLAGIFCVNWQRAAQRALRLGKSWWTAIPKGEDAVLLLDPDDLMGGAPIIAFRRDLDPACGLLQGEKRFDPDPLRLDRALRRTWSTYTLFRNRSLVRCPTAFLRDGVIAAEVIGTRQLRLVPRNLAPPILCGGLSADPGEVRRRCQQLGCPLFATCDDGTEMFLTDCGRGPCPFCPPGFDELLVRAWCVYSSRVPGRWGVILVLAFGAKTPLICFTL